MNKQEFTDALIANRDEAFDRDRTDSKVPDQAMLDAVKLSLSPARQKEVFQDINYEESEKGLASIPDKLKPDEYEAAQLWTSVAAANYDRSEYLSQNVSPLNPDDAAGLIDGVVETASDPIAAKAKMMSDLRAQVTQTPESEQEFCQNLTDYQGFEPVNSFDEAREKFGAQISDGFNVLYAFGGDQQKATDFAVQEAQNIAAMDDTEKQQMRASGLADGPTDVNLGKALADNLSDLNLSQDQNMSK